MAFIINEETVTIITNKAYASCSLQDCPFAEELKMALRRGDEEMAMDMINKDRAIANWVNQENTVSVRGREVVFRTSELDQWRPLHNALVDRIIMMREQGFDPEPMIKFLFNVEKNPSPESKKDLYTFLEANRLPITADGCFLAYKKVTDDYKDCHTRTIDNSPGKVVKMRREDVNPDRNQTCSTGLHVCSGGYLNNFHGAHTMLIKVHPRDVVTVPTDYKNSKMRCCKYRVLKELNDEDVEKIAVYV